MRARIHHKGMVLIFALWVLGILTILAVSVAAGIRQKIFLVARLDERSRMSYLLQAAVKKTAAYIHQEMEVSAFVYTPGVKMNMSNKPLELAQITIGHDHASAVVVDEESKIDLNKTDQIVLSSLLSRVLELKDEDAVKLAAALLDWRQYGESEVTGFFSEDYYSNLQYPYPKKNIDYESPDEMLLVKGMTKQAYDKLTDYVTIYGDGAVNINTASREVLIALGLQDSLVEKILSVRRGKDVNAVTALQPSEMRAIDALNMRGILGTNSYYFSIKALGRLPGSTVPRRVRAVYSAREDKIVYWKER